MNRQRLLHLIEILKKNEAAEKRARRKRRRFDMSDWGSFREHENGTVCCTAACAAGEAALDPVFNRAGLRFMVQIVKKRDVARAELTPAEIKRVRSGESFVWNLDEHEIPLKRFGKSHILVDGGTIIRYRNLDGGTSCQDLGDFFGILEEDAEFIFVPARYSEWYRKKITRQRVIDHIRYVMQKDED